MKVLGLDFDNTLTNYDQLFYDTAKDLNLIPDSIKANKISIRNYLISINNEDSFTKLQGIVYGLRILEADQSVGMFESLKNIKEKGYSLKIISHKTKYPIKGEKYDLHQGALNWLIKNNFFSKSGLNLNRNDVYFETSKEKKIARIEKLQCTHFVDDLPEILNMVSPKIIKIFYNPTEKKIFNEKFLDMNNWCYLNRLLY